MRIGILTYHRSQNYGAQLQAIALRYVLAQMGHDVSIINYWPYYHYEKYALIQPLTMWRQLRRRYWGYFRNLLLYIPWRFKRILSTRRFQNHYSKPYWSPYNSEETYDAIVYGSDQIWRKQVELGVDRYNPVYFGINKLSVSQHISYAASMGVIEANEEDKKFIHKALSSFSKISVREQSLKEFLDGLGLHSQVVLDPTLLMGKDQWDSIVCSSERPIKEKYMLFYKVQQLSFDEKELRRFASSHGLAFYMLCGDIGKRSKGLIDTKGPEALLSLVKHAEMVFTSSYHGLAFSLIYGKPFYVSYSTNASRAESLLTDLGLSHLLLPPKSKVPSDIPTIDYENVYERITEMRKESLEFLKNIE